jgi:hypothetical protein
MSVLDFIFSWAWVPLMGALLGLAVYAIVGILRGDLDGVEPQRSFWDNWPGFPWLL